ncbi:thiamine-phosphate kinase [Patescibacteria group bacterium]|nr:thiamine-phosphate kinase [Patescibacteria group bacterium]
MRKESDFIRNIKANALKSDDLIVGIGDDAAVIDRGDKYELISTDMFAEGDHFRLDWFSDQQVGMKAIECSVSDIFAMGGMPKFVFVSVCVPGIAGKRTDFLENLYEGIFQACKKYNIVLAGGDTTHGEKIVIDVVVVGEVAKERLCLRSGAKVGDAVCVTGNVGNGAAGLELFLKDGQEAKWNSDYAEVVRKYLEPKAQGVKGPILADYVSAMIDVSDGIGSEIRHICEESNARLEEVDFAESDRHGGTDDGFSPSKISARIFADKIPMLDEAVFASSYVKKRALNFALSGGEDFELMFTISSEKLEKLQGEKGFRENEDFYVIGEIIGGNDEPVLVEDEVERSMPGGYDHFSVV